MDNLNEVQPIIDQLKSRSEQQPLSPKQIWNSEMDAAISAISWGKRAQDKSVIALMAGLHLWNDNLYTSHSYSQKIEGDPTGNYWHGIMHRMEADYPNSKYWFRQAGNHPAKQRIPQKTAEYLKRETALDSLPPSQIVNTLKQFRDQQNWNSDDFVDLVQLQENGEGTEATRTMLEKIQQIEFLELFDYSYKAVFND